MAKEKMSIEKKTKLIYSIELIIIAVIFAVVATLQIIGVLGKNEIMQIVFNWITIFGGTWLIVDFLWTLFSKKRRAKNCLLDKILVLPLAIFLITFDIMCFAKLSFVDTRFRQIMLGSAFYYVFVVYLFEGIYHYYKPIPAIIQAIEETEKAEQEQNNPEVVEEKPEEPKEEEKEAE